MLPAPSLAVLPHIQAVMAALFELLDEKELGPFIPRGHGLHSFDLFADDEAMFTLIGPVRKASALLMESVLRETVCAPAYEEAQGLANLVNAQIGGAFVRLGETKGSIAIKSELPLGDAGACLRPQLFGWVEAHLLAIAQVAPLLGPFARGERSYATCREQLGAPGGLN